MSYDELRETEPAPGVATKRKRLQKTYHIPVSPKMEFAISGIWPMTITERQQFMRVLNRMMQAMVMTKDEEDDWDL